MSWKRSGKSLEASEEEYDDDTRSAVLPVGQCLYSREELEERERSGIPPESPEEYFARQKLEAIPAVLTADAETIARIQAMDEDRPKQVLSLPKRNLKRQRTVSDKWRRETVAGFIHCRQYISRWEARRNEGFTGDVPKKNDEKAWTSLMQTTLPSVRLLMQLDQKVCSKILKDMIYNDEPSQQSEQPKQRQQDDKEDVKEDEKGENEGRWSCWRCVWYYALLSRIERPLSVGMEAHLRALHRSFAEIDPAPAVDVLECVLEDYFLVDSN